MDDYDRNYTNWAEQWAPGGPAWPRYEEATMHHDSSRSSELTFLLGPGSKRVVINDYLPAGQMVVTEQEVILSPVGWERLTQVLKRKELVRSGVQRIVERVLANELAWLREAGHEV
jgi:hypothetical protein